MNVRLYTMFDRKFIKMERQVRLIQPVLIRGIQQLT